MTLGVELKTSVTLISAKLGCHISFSIFCFQPALKSDQPSLLNHLQIMTIAKNNQYSVDMYIFVQTVMYTEIVLSS